MPFITRRSLIAPARQGTGTLIADVSSIAELNTVIPAVSEIPTGATGSIIVTGIGIGPLADLASAELIARPFFDDIGLFIIDIRGEGLNTAIIEWVNPAPTGQGVRLAAIVAAVVLLGATALALGALGWAITRIQVFLESLSGTTRFILFGSLLLFALSAFSRSTRSRKRAR